MFLNTIEGKTKKNKFWSTLLDLGMMFLEFSQCTGASVLHKADT